MHVDRGGYLMFVTALALGGAGGYFAAETDLLPHLKRRTEPPPPPPNAVPMPVAIDAGSPVAVAPVDAGPACDDSIGEPEACPPPGLPTVEGGCGPLPLSRCNDFKRTMKPRVAREAIACLNKLTSAERCDPKRIDLCAHFALMNACHDETTNASCDVLVQACAKSPVALSKAECVRSTSGLREAGRDAMLACAKKHCFDKGVLGCEAAPK